MVFPNCYPGAENQKPGPDLASLGATIFDSFIYTGSKRQTKDENRFNPKQEGKNKKIGPNIFILDDLQPLEEDECQVRAGAIAQLFMGDTLDSEARRV
jgi:hypothetical protein